MLVGFSALYLAMPFRLFDTAFVDMRIVVALALIMPAFVSVSFPDVIWRRVAIALVAAITIINVGAVTTVWLSYREDFAAARKSFELLPKGAIVMTAQTGDGGAGLGSIALFRGGRRPQDRGVSPAARC